MEFDFATPITKDIQLNALYKEGSIDPNNPTLENLIAAMQTGNPSLFFPIGSDILDTYNGAPTSWKLVHYGTAIRSDNLATVQGAYLMLNREALSASQFASSANIERGYLYSNVHSYVTTGGGYTTASQYAITIKVSYCGMSGIGASATIDYAIGDCKFFAPSSTNLGTISNPNDIVWDYFKTNSNATRIWHSSTGPAIDYWTRDWSGTYRSYEYYMRYVQASGAFQTSPGYSGTWALSNYYSIPCCFIPAYPQE